MDGQAGFGSRTGTWHGGGLKQRVEVGPASDTGASPDADMTLRNTVHSGEQAVWVRVIQTNGAMAWSSPVAVIRKEE